MADSVSPLTSALTSGAPETIGPADRARTVLAALTALRAEDVRNLSALFAREKTTHNLHTQLVEVRSLREYGVLDARIDLGPESEPHAKDRLVGEAVHTALTSKVREQVRCWPTGTTASSGLPQLAARIPQLPRRSRALTAGETDADTALSAARTGDVDDFAAELASWLSTDVLFTSLPGPYTVPAPQLTSETLPLALASKLVRDLTDYCGSQLDALRRAHAGESLETMLDRLKHFESQTYSVHPAAMLSTAPPDLENVLARIDVRPSITARSIGARLAKLARENADNDVPANPDPYAAEVEYNPDFVARLGELLGDATSDWRDAELISAFAIPLANVHSEAARLPSRASARQPPYDPSQVTIYLAPWSTTLALSDVGSEVEDRLTLAGETPRLLTEF